MDLREQALLNCKPEAHWYYASKASALMHFLNHSHFESILDVGAGSAFFSKYLLEHTHAQSARCIDPNYNVDDSLSIDGKPLIRQRKAPETFDEQLVLMMDVLEHIPDDVHFLKDYVSRAQPGTCFLITVPASQFLWSAHDVYLGHYRRYVLSQLEKTVGDSGLIIQNSAYYFAAIFPIAAATRLMTKHGQKQEPASSQLKIHRPWVNRLLTTICQLELPFMGFNKLGGLSIFCLAHKPMSAER